MRTQPYRPICRPIHTGIFQSREYRSLPSDGHGRLLLLSLLIHPHGGTFHLPGLYQVGREGLREAASMPKRSFDKGFADLLAAKLLEIDDEVRLLWVSVALQFVGPPSNPNVVKGFVRAFTQLPQSTLLASAIAEYRTLLEPFGKAFTAPLENHFDTLCGGLALREVKRSQSISGTKVKQNHDDGAIAQGANNRNKDRDNNIFTNNNDHGSHDSLDWRCVAAHAQERGWPKVTQARVEQLMTQSPSLQWADFLQISSSIRDRPDLHDPLSYLFGIARRMAADGRIAVHQDEDAEDSPAQDGQELTFDD